MVLICVYQASCSPPSAWFKWVDNSVLFISWTSNSAFNFLICSAWSSTVFSASIFFLQSWSLPRRARLSSGRIGSASREQVRASSSVLAYWSSPSVVGGWWRSTSCCRGPRMKRILCGQAEVFGIPLNVQNRACQGIIDQLRGKRVLYVRQHKNRAQKGWTQVRRQVYKVKSYSTYWNLTVWVFGLMSAIGRDPSQSTRCPLSHGRAWVLARLCLLLFQLSKG